MHYGSSIPAFTWTGSACGENHFDVNVRVSVSFIKIRTSMHDYGSSIPAFTSYVDGVALRVYARTRCLFVNVREWRGGVVTGHARALIRINGQRSKPLKLGVPDDSGLRP